MILTRKLIANIFKLAFIVLMSAQLTLTSSNLIKAMGNKKADASPKGQQVANIGLMGVNIREWKTLLVGRQSARKRSLDFSPNGKLLAVTGQDGVSVWDTSELRKLRIFRRPGQEWSEFVAFSSDGQLLAAAGDIDKDESGYLHRIIVWETSTGNEVAEIRSKEYFHSVAFSPDLHLIAYSIINSTDDKANNIAVWNIESQQEITNLRSERNSIGELAFSPDGRFLAGGCPELEICIWDVATFRKMARVSSETSNRTRSPGRKADSNEVVVLERSKDQLKKKGLQPAPIDSSVISFDSHKYHGVMAFSLDGKILATVKGSFIRDENYCGRFMLWDTKGWQLIKSSKVYPECIDSASFSPDSKLLAAGMGDGTVRLWDVPSGEELTTLKANKVPSHSESRSQVVTSIRFSPDGHILAALSANGTLKLWTID